jgi:hypothetical protein
MSAFTPEQEARLAEIVRGELSEERSGQYGRRRADWLTFDPVRAGRPVTANQVERVLRPLFTALLRMAAQLPDPGYPAFGLQQAIQRTQELTHRSSPVVEAERAVEKAKAAALAELALDPVPTGGGYEGSYDTFAGLFTAALNLKSSRWPSPDQPAESEPPQAAAATASAPASSPPAPGNAREGG